VQQCSQLLATLQQNNLEMLEITKNVVNCVFDCFMPEMQEEVVKGAKERLRERKATREGQDSKYVSMEPIAKVEEPQAE
jgi:hypothetical protein